MTVVYEAGYSLPSGDEPLTHARILHARNWQPIKTITASNGATDYPVSNLLTTTTYDKFRIRDNYMPDTLDFNTSWTTNNVGISGDGKTLDDGTATGSHYVRLVRTFGNTNDHVFAVEVERQTQQSIQLEIDDGTDQHKRWFDLAMLALGTGSGPSGTPDAEISELPNGNILCLMRFNPTTGTGYAEIQLSDTTMSGSHTGNDRTTRFFNVWLHPSDCDITIDTFDDLEADCFCIAAHNLGTRGATVTFAHDDDLNGTYTTIATLEPTDDSPIMCIFEPVDARRWRVTIAGAAMPELGVVRVGKALDMPRPISGAHKPLYLSRNTELRTGESETGEFIARTIQRKWLESGFSWNILTDTWVDANWPDVQEALEKEPFFIAWYPTSVAEVGYCWTSSVPQPAYSGSANFMNVSIDVRGHSYD